MKFLLPCLLMCFCCIYCDVQCDAQTAPPYNRFQFHNYKWKALHTPLFQLYFPVGYDSLASFASVQLPDIISEVKKATTVDVKSMPNLIIYPSLDQLYESNIGMHEQQIQTFPTINLKGSRVMIAFDGSYEHLRLRIKKAWVRLCWEEQFKNNVEEQLSSKQALIPLWFKEGCIDYFAKGWSIENEASIQGLLAKPAVKSFEAMTAESAALSGQAFCYFLSEKYRRDAVMQIFFQLRQGKSLSRGIRLVTKRRLDTLENECFRYYQQRNITSQNQVTNNNDTLQVFLEKAYKAKLFSLKYNNDSTSTIFMLEKNNRRDVYVAKTKELLNPKSTIRLKLKPFAHYLLPPWLNEYSNDNYPLIYLPQKGSGIVLVQPVKGKIKLLFYNENGSQTTERIAYGIDGINTITQWSASQWLLSAYRRGRSDIVSYDMNAARYIPLTKDYADHTELTLSKGNTPQIGYRSGYPADSLYHKDTVTKHYGVYLKSIDDDLKSVAASPETLVAKDSAYIQWSHPDFSLTDNYTIIHTKTGSEQTETFSPNQLPLSNANANSPIRHWLKDYLKDLKIKDSIKALLIKAGSGETSFLHKVLHPEDEKKAAQLHQDSIPQKCGLHL